MGYCFEDPKHPRLIAGGARREAVGGMSEAKVREAMSRSAEYKHAYLFTSETTFSTWVVWGNMSTGWTWTMS